VKLYGRRNSINVLPVLWCLEELGLRYERRVVGGSFGGVDADFLVLNPTGRIPVLEDDGFVLWESNVIIRYLFDVHGAGASAHKDGRERAHNDQWMEWYKTTLYPAFVMLYQQFVRIEPAERDAQRMRDLTRTVGELMRIPDEELQRRPYLGGERFGMGDIPLGVAMYRHRSLPVERPTLIGLDGWYERLRARPIYQACVIRPFGLTPVEFVALEQEDRAETNEISQSDIQIAYIDNRDGPSYAGAEGNLDGRRAQNCSSQRQPEHCSRR
jgi:glutathione S-transferase